VIWNRAVFVLFYGGLDSLRFFIMGFLVFVYGSRFNLWVVLLLLCFWGKSFSIHGTVSSVLSLVCGLDVDPGSL
jgi:hypothetical protein